MEAIKASPKEVKTTNFGKGRSSTIDNQLVENYIQNTFNIPSTEVNITNILYMITGLSDLNNIRFFRSKCSQTRC